MSKARVTGENVIVKLFSENSDLFPIVLDFDDCTINSSRKSDSYRAIGKKATRHNVLNNSDYRITLTRARRDNYLQALINYIDIHHKMGLETPRFTIYHITTHVFSIDDLTVEDDLLFKNQRQITDPLKTSFVPKQINDLVNLIGSTTNNITRLSNNVPIPQEFRNGVQQINNIVQPIVNAKNTISSTVSNIQNQVNSATELVKNTFNRIKDFIKSDPKKSPFKESYVYYEVTLSEDMFSDKPKEFSNESISFNCSYRESITETNEFEDQYLLQILDYGINQKIQQKINEINKTSNSYILDIDKDLYNYSTGF